MPTIKDVAKRAGVSPTTAKRALYEPHLLAPETLERVRKAIEELGYEPDLNAGGLRRGWNRTLGLVVGDILEPFFAALARAVIQRAREKGYGVITVENEYRADHELPLLRTLHGYRVAGILLRSGFWGSNLGYLKRLQSRGVAVVEVDHFYPGSPFSHVMLDNERGVLEGVRYLAELGHRRIAFLGYIGNPEVPDERSLAFPKAMRALGFPLPEAYLRPLPALGEPGAYALTHELMRLPEPPTALFAVSGAGAAGALRALKELGLRIPQDVSLLTFDNYSWMELVDPPLDAIEQPVEEMARLATELVVRMVESRDPSLVVHYRLPGRLIRRGSCAPPRG
ncbi:LacI family DNA-binding transcriptional regulator (plasmid) [Thermus thermophilus]|uniref:LacI family DNA-binding transcriptional regulator n=1 Tax=Thermus thermophilus TaxID=274 RepID=UPI0030E41FAC